MKNTKQEQKFKVYCSTNINDTVNKSLIAEMVEKDEPLILEAVISTNSVDLDGDYMTNECLEDMKKQALGLNIFLDHHHTTDQIVGSITEVIQTSSDVIKVKFNVIPSYEWYIMEFLENGVNLGMSIGASVLDFEDTETGWKINKVKLVEVSITGIPANWDTFGTVQVSKNISDDEVVAKCINGACKQIIDNLSLQTVSKDFEDGEDPDDDGHITEEEVIKLINEAMITLKKQIITEIVSEYNLDGKKHQEEDDGSDASTNSSNDSEDKEKNLDMEKEEIVELIKEHSLNEEIVKGLIIDTLKEFKEAEVTEEAPIIDVEEEVDVTKAIEEPVEEEETETEPVEEEPAEEEPIEEETVEEPVTEKPAETEPTIDVEELKKSLKEELRAEIEKEVEADFLKALSIERKPVAHEQPKAEKNLEDNVEKTKGNVMSAREMAEHLIINQ